MDVDDESPMFQADVNTNKDSEEMEEVHTTGPTPSAEEIESMCMYIDLLQKQLAKAKETIKSNSVELGRLEGLERERDRYRAVSRTITVLSLAHQNKILQQELNNSRQGISGKEARYLDARLQVQDLKEALKIKEMEVEELKEARGQMPTNDEDLLEGYKAMRDVFDSLRSTLSCSLCYETFKPNDVLTLECGHTMCKSCLKNWSDTNFRLYNLATTPDCPECRKPGQHYVKVYILEEVVRTVDRLDRLEAEMEAKKTEARKAVIKEQAPRLSASPDLESDPEDGHTSLVYERTRSQYRYEGSPTSSDV